MRGSTQITTALVINDEEPESILEQPPVELPPELLAQLLRFSQVLVELGLLQRSITDDELFLLENSHDFVEHVVPLINPNAFNADDIIAGIAVDHQGDAARKTISISCVFGDVELSMQLEANALQFGVACYPVNEEQEHLPVQEALRIFVDDLSHIDLIHNLSLMQKVMQADLRSRIATPAFLRAFVHAAPVTDVADYALIVLKQLEPQGSMQAN